MCTHMLNNSTPRFYRQMLGLLVSYVVLSGSLPLFHNVLHKLYRQIVERELSFPEQAWRSVAKGAQDMKPTVRFCGFRFLAVSVRTVRGSGGSRFGRFAVQAVRAGALGRGAGAIGCYIQNFRFF